MHSEATGTGKEQQTGRFSYAQYRSKVYHVHQVCYVLQDRRISRLISRTFLEDLPLRPGSGWGRRLDRRNPAGAASSDVHLPAYSGRGWEPSKGHWRPLPRRWMAQGACPLTRYSGVGLGETTGPSKPRRGSFERCVSTRCPGVGWEKTTADSCPTGPSLDVTGAMSAYPSSRGRVGKDDSSFWKARRVAGYRRRRIVLPENPGSGRGTIAFVTFSMCLGASLRQKAGRKMSRHVWSRPTEYYDYLNMLEKPRLPKFELVSELEVGRGSFVGAGHAWIVRDTENGIICLQSYSTIVSFKVGEKVIDCWSGKTRATTHHQSRFRAA